MGSVLTPLYTGIENALALPHATTGCGQCAAVCPVGIPLPGLMRELRKTQIERRLRPWPERLGWLARRAARYLAWLADADGRIRIFGLAPGWSAGRDLPTGGGRTFHELYAAQQRK